MLHACRLHIDTAILLCVLPAHIVRTWSNCSVQHILHICRTWLVYVQHTCNTCANCIQKCVRMRAFFFFNKGHHCQDVDHCQYHLGIDHCQDGNRCQDRDPSQNENKHADD